ncbi:MAG: DUF4124 domain-containing protein [Gammaproteobacteria bacterium]
MKAMVALALLAVATSASAQMYKWTDERGVVHYSDTPAPPSAKAGQLKTGAAGESSVALPYELARAARNQPVVLYTTSGCAPCDQARDFLKKRGIPFTEKTVSSAADAAAARDAGGNGQLPLLLVGRTKLLGYEPGGWTSALNSAAYPAKSMLPSSYRFTAEPAAPVTATAEADVPAEKKEVHPRAVDLPKKQDRSDLPPGFQF